MLGWMAWTTPVAVFFGGIGLMLAAMTVWEIRSPSVMRRGFLPIATTRGDRLFIGLLCYFESGTESPFRFYYLLSLTCCAIRYSPRTTFATCGLD